jgi:phosphoribosylformimino-5-aminoimidazole carboxamide ribotide isomerase
VALLGRHSPIPVTYAGGVRDIADMERVKVGARRAAAWPLCAYAAAQDNVWRSLECVRSMVRACSAPSASGALMLQLLGGGRVDVSIGSALDIFGGALPYEEVVRWGKAQEAAAAAGAPGAPAASHTIPLAY